MITLDKIRLTGLLTENPARGVFPFLLPEPYVTRASRRRLPAAPLLRKLPYGARLRGLRERLDHPAAATRDRARRRELARVAAPPRARRGRAGRGAPASSAHLMNEIAAPPAPRRESAAGGCLRLRHQTGQRAWLRRKAALTCQPCKTNDLISTRVPCA